MEYLLDTVGLVRHFTGVGKIGKKAAQIIDAIETSDDVIVISVISLMEIMYLAEKNRIEIDLAKTLDRIAASSKYSIVDLSSDILRVAQSVVFPELHDRLILATAKWLGISVISSDSAFLQVEGLEVVWD